MQMLACSQLGLSTAGRKPPLTPVRRLNSPDCDIRAIAVVHRPWRDVQRLLRECCHGQEISCQSAPSGAYLLGL